MSLSSAHTPTCTTRRCPVRSAWYVGRPAAADTRANQTSSEPSVGPCPESTAADTQYTTAPPDAEMRWALCAVHTDSFWTSRGFAVGRDAAPSGAAARPLPSGEPQILALAMPLSSLFRGGRPGAANESAAVAAAAAAAAVAAAAAAVGRAPPAATLLPLLLPRELRRRLLLPSCRAVAAAAVVRAAWSPGAASLLLLLSGEPSRRPAPPCCCRCCCSFGFG